MPNEVAMPKSIPDGNKEAHRVILQPGDWRILLAYAAAHDTTASRLVRGAVHGLVVGMTKRGWSGEGKRKKS
jgi:hypothetical protein